MPELNSLSTQFRQARFVSVPLIAVNTFDPAETIRTLTWAILDSATLAEVSTDSVNDFELLPHPVLKWDAGHGLLPLNKPASAFHEQYIGAKQNTTINTAETLRILERAPEKTLCFIQAAHRFLNNDFVAQGVWNLRDKWKATGSTLVLLGTGIKIPADLIHDIIVFDERLPTATQLESIIKDQHEYANLPTPSAEVLEKAIDAVQGLAAFSAEQVTALSLTKEGLNLDRLWERKRQLIDSTPGLSIWRGDETFEHIGGLDAIKVFLSKLLKARRRPRCIVFLDELEKAMSGASNKAGDSSGVSQNMLGTMLSFMQDHRAGGAIFVGPPGCSKSMLAKAVGAEAGIPTITLDLGGMKDKLIGESERQLRQALEIISAVSQDQALFLATSNAVDMLPPELIRRFSYGCWYFALPTAEERATIWQLYQAKYALSDTDPLPNDERWTGAEIARCAGLSWELAIPLRDAAQYIVPLAVSAKESIAKLEEQAHHTFLCASKGGVYSKDTPPTSRSLTPKRKIGLAS